jgi:hypothetical protein
MCMQSANLHLADGSNHLQLLVSTCADSARTKESNMKKILLTLMTLVVSAAAISQPAPPPRSVAPHMDRPQMQPHGRSHAAKKRKVWVPAHRVHGRMVRGHYVWR